MALAFFAQSIIPAGYMPTFQTGKLFEITICHGDDLAKVLVDENMRPVKTMGGSQDNHGTSGKDHVQFCPYTAVSTKNIALTTFLYLFTEKLTYERAVERISSPFISYFFHLPYEGRAPPYSLA